MPLHLEELLVRSDFRSVDRCHTGFLLKQMDDVFFLVCAGTNSLRSSIDHILVDRPHFEARIFTERASVGFRLVLVFEAIERPAIVRVLWEVGRRRLLLGVPKLKTSCSHFSIINKLLLITAEN